MKARGHQTGVDHRDRQRAYRQRHMAAGGRTNAIAILVGAATGTFLLWPIYARFAALPMGGSARRLVERRTEETNSR